MTVGTVSSTVNPGKCTFCCWMKTGTRSSRSARKVWVMVCTATPLRALVPAPQHCRGSDVDNDTYVCTLGETCGGYPIISSLNKVEVTNLNIENLDFISEVLSTFGATAQGTQASPLSITQDCKEGWTPNGSADELMGDMARHPVHVVCRTGSL